MNQDEENEKIALLRALSTVMCELEYPFHTRRFPATEYLRRKYWDLFIEYERRFGTVLLHDALNRE